MGTSLRQIGVYDARGDSIACVVKGEQFAPNHLIAGGFYFWWIEGDASDTQESLPDSEWVGPFETEQEAIDDCRELCGLILR